jgi:hypothetical protein
VIEPRIYRAGFLPALFCVVVAMFSLENRPSPLPQGLAADVLFDGRLARQTLEDVVARHPDRRPGSAGDAAAAGMVAQQLNRRGFTVVRRRFEFGGERLENVVATRPGATRDRIVVMAARDSASVPDATGSAADTAALLELARVFEGRAARSTLVLASVDGSALGDAGARSFLGTAEDRGRIRAIVVLSNLAASTSRGSLIVAWSDGASRANIALERTVASSLRQELGGLPEDEGPLGQLARLAFPIGIGAQGVLLEKDAGAVRISGSGELPPERTGLDTVNVDRLGQLGRGALRAVSAIDSRRDLEHGPRAYVIAARKVVPGWAIALLAAALLLPALVASVDAFARASRRREGVARWWAWIGACVLPFALGLAVAELLTVAGQAPDAPPAAFPPDQEPLGGAGLAALGLVAATVALGWLLLRPLVAGRLDASAPGAGAVTALALSLAALAVWIANPFAGLVLVPAVHLWILAMVAEVRRPAAAALLLGGLAAPLGVAVYYLARLSLDPLEGAWYLFLLITGHHAGLATALLGCAALGVLGATIAVVAARRPELAPPDGAAAAGPRLRGPGGYAGPGSLGGTESALRR